MSFSQNPQFQVYYKPYRIPKFMNNGLNAKSVIWSLRNIIEKQYYTNNSGQRATTFLGKESMEMAIKREREVTKME